LTQLETAYGKSTGTTMWDNDRFSERLLGWMRCPNLSSSASNIVRR
jgi:hypothetical protein